MPLKLNAAGALDLLLEAAGLFFCGIGRGSGEAVLW